MFFIGNIESSIFNQKSIPILNLMCYKGTLAIRCETGRRKKMGADIMLSQSEIDKLIKQMEEEKKAKENN